MRKINTIWAAIVICLAIVIAPITAYADGEYESPYSSELDTYRDSVSADYPAALYAVTYGLTVDSSYWHNYVTADCPIFFVSRDASDGHGDVYIAYWDGSNVSFVGTGIRDHTWHLYGQSNGYYSTYGNSMMGNWYVNQGNSGTVNGYIFDTEQSAKAFFQSGDESGVLNKPTQPFNFNTDHDFSKDVYHTDVPVPELSNISLSGFAVNNASSDLYIDLIVDTSFYNIIHGGAAQNASVAYYPKDSVFSSHRYNFTVYDAAYNNAYISFSDMYGTTCIVDDLVNDFKSWSSAYPTHKNLSDYSWWHHSSGNYTTVFSNYNNYYSSIGSNDEEKLVKSGQISVKYYVRFYTMSDGSLKYGQWASYTYTPFAYGSAETGEYGQNMSLLTVGTVVSDTSGEPLTVGSDRYVQSNTDGTIKAYNPSSTWFSNVSETNNIDDSGLWNTVSDLVGSMGQVPILIASVFQFMPSWVLGMIGAGIALLVILRIVGR